MKTLIILAAFILSSESLAQIHKEEMKKLEPLAGQWKGSATYRMGPGEPQVVQQHEQIEFKLDGTVLLIEGLGKAGDRTVHHALGIVIFNTQEKKFNFRSYLHDGRTTDAWFEVSAPGKYMWGFSTPQGKLRYTITITENTWKETGEFSVDGNTWMNVIEMNLTKI
ncbi:MAG: DUF1579 domain-containing protein [Bacteroidetes bacterium CHB5]|nr:DUF1579 domain-containing protein [Bacteroidetes bacterium CHB5]